MTLLPDTPADGALDVIIAAADGSGPVLQWRDQAAGLVCGRPSAMDPEQHDITYGAYLHQADEPLQEEDVIGDEDGECSRQIQLAPSQLSCDENGDPQNWEWIVAAIDVKYAACSPTPIQTHVFSFTTASCQPTVDEVRVQYGDKYFLQNVGVENEFDARVDWNGPAYQTPPATPLDGTVYFEINGERKPPDGIDGDLQGARTTFDMGQDFKAGWDGGANVVKIWAEYRPEAGGPLYLTEMKNVTPLVFPFPAWATQVNLGPFSADLGEGVVEYENEAAYPEPAFEASVDVPKAVPYLGGRELGILESQAKASVNASSAGEGKLGLEGQTGLGLGAFNIAGELGGEGQFKFQMGDGLRMDKAKLKLGISTPFKKEMTLADLVPAIKAAEEWWLGGRSGQESDPLHRRRGRHHAQDRHRGRFRPKGPRCVGLRRLHRARRTGAQGHSDLQTLREALGAGLRRRHALPRVQLPRRPGLFPADGHRSRLWGLAPRLALGKRVQVRRHLRPARRVQQRRRYRRTPQMADDGWSLMGRAYLTADYNTFVGHTRPLAATSTTATSATAETPLIANVYPLTEPSLAVRADGARTWPTSSTTRPSRSGRARSWSLCNGTAHLSSGRRR